MVREARCRPYEPVLVLLTFLLLAGACAPRLILEGELCHYPLMLGIGLREEWVGGEWHPIVTVVAQNVTAYSVAIVENLNIANRGGFFLTVEDLSTGAELYPPDVDVFFVRQDYKCLPPGGIHRFDVDLLSWRWVFNGRKGGELEAFALEDGWYLVSVSYWHEPNILGAHCPRVRGRFTSNPVVFQWGHGRLRAIRDDTVGYGYWRGMWIRERARAFLEGASKGPTNDGRMMEPPGSLPVASGSCA